MKDEYYILKVIDGNTTLYWSGNNWHPYIDKAKLMILVQADELLLRMNEFSLLKPQLSNCSAIIKEIYEK